MKETMWAKLKEFDGGRYVRPPNSFSRLEYQARFKINRSSAQRRILSLIKAGRVKKLRTARNEWYYVLVEGEGK